MQLIRFDSLPVTPWKNGGGITRQLLVYPPAANLDTFTLRISIADVDSDGPFSDFSGVDRTLGLLSGNGLALHEDGKEIASLHAGGPLLAFDGGRAISSTRLNGKVQDFNVMTRRGRASHQTRYLQVKEPVALHSNGPMLLLLAEGSSLLASDGHDTQQLGYRDALWLPTPATLQLMATAPCRLIVVEASFT
ncbi:HutD/Ves family protein [Vogesella oryzae]|uniref:HutD/Ves family protein n=1 Tax=Vogesella oryzae TaxID=1735285 RepID=UPI001583A58E|nr:HutD family protein [Vogesella oryzae]